MIDLSKVTGLADSVRGGITQIADASGRVIWAAGGGDTVILEVEKITSDTSAGETTYTDEQFILLDIYPKTNGTVKVSYGGLTKTITDTSGAEEPNAQQVFFGTFNGVSDSVATPSSGELTIEGDYYAFGCSTFSDGTGVKTFQYTCACVTAVDSFGVSTLIPTNAFGSTLKKGVSLTAITIPNSIISIGNAAFAASTDLMSATIGNGVASIGPTAFALCSSLTSVSFRNTDGWYVTETEGGDISTGTAVDVSDPANNVTLLVTTYASRYWYRV